MAPVQITGAALGPHTFRVGPWTDGSGNLWMVALNASNQVTAYTSSTAGASWSASTSYTTTTMANMNIDAQPDSRTAATFIDVLCQDASHALNILRFTISGASWALRSSGTQPVAGVDSGTSYPAFFARRSTGDYVVVYSGPLHASSYRSTYYTITSTSGAWGTVGPAELDPGDAYHYDVKPCVLGASDIVHCLLYTSRFNYYLAEQNISAANAVSAPQRAAANSVGGGLYRYTIFYDPAIGLICSPVASGTAPGRSASTTPTSWALDTNGIGSDAQGTCPMTFAYDPTIGVIAFFRDTASTDIFQNSAATTTWTTGGTLFDAAGSPARISTSGVRITPSGGSPQIGVVYVDATPVYYDSFTLAATTQTVLPDADIDATGWSTAPLFSKLNDSSDATVVTATLA